MSTTYVENQQPIILPPDGQLRIAFVGEAPLMRKSKPESHLSAPLVTNLTFGSALSVSSDRTVSLVICPESKLPGIK